MNEWKELFFVTKKLKKKKNKWLQVQDDDPGVQTRPSETLL